MIKLLKIIRSMTLSSQLNIIFKIRILLNIVLQKLPTCIREVLTEKL